jgi:methyl-accepting chemotaxis protein
MQLRTSKTVSITKTREESYFIKYDRREMEEANNMKNNQSQKNMSSIKSKLVFLLVTLVVIPIIALGSISYITARDILSSELKESSKQITDKINYSLDIYFESNEKNLDMLSKNFNVTDVLNMQPDQMKYVFNALGNVKDAHPDIANVYIGTHNKKMFIYPEADLPAGFDPTSRPWYQRAVKEGKIIWTDPYLDTATKQLTITVAKPVNSSSGEFTGVVAMDITLDQLSNHLGETKLGRNGYFTMTDGNGIIELHPNKDLIGKEIPVKELKDAVLTGTAEAVDYEYDGDKKFGVFIKNERIGWHLIGTMSYNEINSQMSSIIFKTSAAGIIIAIIAVIIGIFVSRPMTKSLQVLVEDVKKIGGGDFTVRSNVRSNDEIGVLASTVNKMVEDVGSLMRNIGGVSNEVTSAAHTLAATSEETNASIEEVAKTISEVAGAANDQAISTESGLEKTAELADSIQAVANAIGRVKEILNEANQLNSNGINIVKVLTVKTNESNSSAQRVGEVVGEVDGRTNQIGTIISTISQIADQTNLLALNASIEAARAGEAGRGFAVVADEIRKLAEQSARAASQIRDLITGIQAQSKHAVDTMNKARGIVVEQTNAVTETEAIFNEITSTVQVINKEVENIISLNAGMISRKEGIMEIMESIAASAQQSSASTQEISASTEEQLATIEEVTRTAENLNHLSIKLNKEIEKFKV